MAEISQELVERMATVIRAYAHSDGSHIKTGRSVHAELLAVASELPVPVDPDLLEAREVAASYCQKGSYISISAGEASANHIRAGLRDDDTFVQAMLAAIKRGKEIARQSPPADGERS